MDLSSKSFPAPPPPQGNPREHSQNPRTRPEDPHRHYGMASSSAPYVPHSTPFNYQDTTPVNGHDPSLYYAPGPAPPHDVTPCRQAFYAQPSPLFLHNGYVPTAQSLPSFFETTYDYGADMVDGMLQRDCGKIREQLQKNAQEKCAKKKEAKRSCKEDEGEPFSDRSGRGNMGTLQSLLYDTLEQEVAALDVLRQQIAQFAVLTQNAHKFCNMEMINPLLAAHQGLAGGAPPHFMPRQPPPARHTLRPTTHRPMMPYPGLRAQAPPPAHMNNFRRPRAGAPFPGPPQRPKSPMAIAMECLHDVENRLKNCERVVANKINMYEKHIKRPHDVPRGDPNDIQYLAMQTLRDIEDRLKVTERKMDTTRGGNRCAQER